MLQRLQKVGLPVTQLHTDREKREDQSLVIRKFRMTVTVRIAATDYDRSPSTTGSMSEYRVPVLASYRPFG